MVVFWIVFSIVLLLLVNKGFNVVPEARVRLVERLGKYNRTLKPGLSFIIPFVERIKLPRIITFNKEVGSDSEAGPAVVDLADEKGNITTQEVILDPPQITAISKDNAEVSPDAVIYFRIVDPVRATYEIENLGRSIYMLLETTLRQQIGMLTTDEIIVGRETIGRTVKSALDEAASGWGTFITRVELEEIGFPAEIQNALSDQRAAELKGRATVTEAEREKEAVILRAEAEKADAVLSAEAEKQSVILKAEGNFEKDRLMAEGAFLKASREEEGKAKGVEAMARALAKNPDAVVAMRTLEAQEEVAAHIGQSNNALIIPQETAGLFGAIKSIGKLLNTDLEKTAVEQQPRKAEENE